MRSLLQSCVTKVKSIYNTTNRFLILRSIGGLVNATYQWHYGEKQYSNFRVIAWLQKALDKITSFFIFFGSLFSKTKQNNIRQLIEKFARMRYLAGLDVNKDNKPTCAYFVSKYDHNGAVITGEVLKYYHLYKIANLSKYYIVHPYVVSGAYNIQDHMQTLKSVKLINIISHGWPQGIDLDSHLSLPTAFENITKDTDIILDACSTGAGKGSFADSLAQTTHSTVFGSAEPLFFSKPVIEKKIDGPRVIAVDHGFCIHKPYQMRCFNYSA